jgi:hypothetical protein
MNTISSRERGAVGIMTFVSIGLGLFVIIFAALSVWAYVNYIDQKDNVDAKVSRAVATAEKQQADKLETKFAQREKEPLRSFASPSDFGTLGFKYPKTWSVYVANDGSSNGAGSNSFTAYLNPATVPPVADTASRYALRVSILDQQYEDVISTYKEQVKDGILKTSAVKASGQTGARLDGTFSKDIRGAAVIFKIRDKTAVLRTDADTFKPDFDALVKTINFIQ